MSACTDCESCVRAEFEVVPTYLQRRRGTPNRCGIFALNEQSVLAVAPIDYPEVDVVHAQGDHDDVPVFE